MKKVADAIHSQLSDDVTSSEIPLFYLTDLESKKLSTNIMLSRPQFHFLAQGISGDRPTSGLSSSLTDDLSNAVGEGYTLVTVPGKRGRIE